MIHSIELVNFQSHEFSIIKLNPGFNVITGASDSGKSAIIRAFEWVRTNRPLGDEFKNWSSKPKDEVKVTIHLDDCAIEKKRVGGKNSYTIYRKRKEPKVFEAIKSDVPAEITEILDMEDINVQSQHQGYFLLNDSAGEVARKLNDLVGLSIIHHMFKKADGEILKTKEVVEELKEGITTLSENLKAFENLDNVEEEIKQTESLVKRLSNIRDKRNRVQKEVDNIHLVEKESKEKRAFLDKVKPIVENILDDLHAYDKKKEKISQVSHTLSNLREIQDEIKSEEDWLEVTTLYKEIKELLTKYQETSSKVERVGRLITSFRNAESEVKEVERTIERNRRAFKDLLIKSAYCPFCKQKITIEIANKIF